MNRLKFLSLSNFFALALVFLVEHFGAERFWFSALVLYAPAMFFALPLVVLLYLSGKSRAKRLFLFNAAILVVFLVGFAGFHFSRTPKPTNGQLVRAMSFNINAGSRGADKIVAEIRKQNPDFVCLQESAAWREFPDPIPKIRGLLPTWNCVRAGELAILSQHPIRFSSVEPFPIHLGDGILIAQIEIGGRLISVANLHLTIPIAGLPGLAPTNMKRRIAARDKQVAALLKLGEKSDAPDLVLGDFNTPSRGLLYRKIAARWNDSFAIAGRGFGYSFSDSLPMLRIDYVFADPKIGIKRCFVPATNASDHRPVVADCVF